MSLTALLYLLLFITGIAKAFAGRPIYGLYTYFFCFYLHAPARWWGRDLPSLRWAFLAAIATLIAILIHKKKDEKLIIFDFKENKIFLCFVLYIFIQAFWALNFNIHKEYMILSFKFLILMFIIQNGIKSKQDMIGLIVINIIGCSYFTYLGLNQGRGGRMEGLGTPGLESANQLGQHIAVVLIFSSYLLLHNFGKKKYLIVPFILATLNGLMLTQSRGAILGMAIGGLLAIFFIPRTTKKIFMFYGFLAVSAGAMLTGEHIIERFNSMMPSEEQEQDKSAGSRIVIIKAQVEMFLEKPIQGWGHRGTLLLSPIYIPEEYMTTAGDKEAGARRASHNLLMSLLVDHGLIGTLLYFGIVGACCFKLIKLRRFKSKHHDSILFSIILTGFVIALVSFILSGMGSNNKKLEIDVWIFAVVPLLFHWLEKLEKGESDESQESNKPNKQIGTD